MVSTAVTETQFTQAFKDLLAKGGDAALNKIREVAFAEFTEAGFPTVKNEDWKYTNVASVGKVDWLPASAFGGSSDGDGYSGELSKFSYERNGFTALNLAFADIKVIRFAKETSVVEPIELTFSPDENTAIFPHIIVIAEPGSNATIGSPSRARPRRIRASSRDIGPCSASG